MSVKVFEALMARALTAMTELEWNGLCSDIGKNFELDRITWQQHELLFKLVRRLWVSEGTE